MCKDVSALCDFKRCCRGMQMHLQDVEMHLKSYHLGDHCAVDLPLLHHVKNTHYLCRFFCFLTNVCINKLSDLFISFYYFILFFLLFFFFNFFVNFQYCSTSCVPLSWAADHIWKWLDLRYGCNIWTDVSRQKVSTSYCFFMKYYFASPFPYTVYYWL
jgi:hypothetical protein